MTGAAGGPEEIEFVLRRRIQRAEGGGFDLLLAAEERELLRDMPDQLRRLLAEAEPGDPALARLFPPAYTDDPERSAEYDRLMRGDLVDRRMAALSVMEDTVDATQLTEEQLLSWMNAINDVRLVLGTRLDVTEDLYEEGLPPDDPRFDAFNVFTYLGVLMEHIVEALAGPDEDEEDETDDDQGD